MSAEQTGLRKRQQIANANRTMFLWVAAASVIVGIALVVASFLFNKLVFNERVLAEKQHTSSVLSNNLDSVDELKDNIRVLNTNSALRSVMTGDESEPVQVVLDALPASANSTALGSSLQQKFLNKSGLKVQSITITPVLGVEQETGEELDVVSDDGDEGPAANAIAFNFVVTATGPDPLRDLLRQLEKSIRTIDVTHISLDVQNRSTFVLTVDGNAFYEPAKSVKLGEKTVEP